MESRFSVVIVEDDFLIMEYLRELSQDIGLNVLGTADVAEQAVTTILENRPDFVFMDLRLGGDRDGVDVAQAIQPDMPDLKIIYITGSSEPTSLARISADHPYEVLIKPVVERDLRRAVGIPVN